MGEKEKKEVFIEERLCTWNRTNEDPIQGLGFRKDEDAKGKEKVFWTTNLT